MPWSKVAIIGDGHPTFNTNPYNGYINPSYWVDDHPLLYGNNRSLDPGTYKLHCSITWKLKMDPLKRRCSTFWKLSCSAFILNLGGVSYENKYIIVNIYIYIYYNKYTIYIYIYIYK